MPNCEALVKVQVSEEPELGVHIEPFVGVQVYGPEVLGEAE